jgi:hypothetical protein
VTLILGIRCTGGVVLGSDGAVTSAWLGQPTIQQQTVGKIHVVSGSVLVGVSGPVGLGQRIELEFKRQLDSGRIAGRSAVEVGAILRTAFWTNVLSQEFLVASALQPVLGGLAQQDALCAILIALPAGDRTELIQFDHTASPEVASDELPFATIGVGQTIADPFLAFIKRIFWPTRLPSLAEGTFAALWTLRHAISVHPGGVAKPISLYNLAKETAGWKAKRLDDKDLAEHEQMIAAAEDHLRRVFETPAPRNPPPPSP